MSTVNSTFKTDFVIYILCNTIFCFSVLSVVRIIVSILYYTSKISNFITLLLLVLKKTPNKYNTIVSKLFHFTPPRYSFPSHTSQRFSAHIWNITQLLFVIAFVGMLEQNGVVSICGFQYIKSTCYWLVFQLKTFEIKGWALILIFTLIVQLGLALTEIYCIFFFF